MRRLGKFLSAVALVVAVGGSVALATLEARDLNPYPRKMYDPNYGEGWWCADPFCESPTDPLCCGA